MLVNLTSQDSIAVLSLANGAANPISPALAADLNSALDDVENDRECRGLVLTSESEKFFSIGFDIPSLYPIDEKGFLEFFRTFNRACLRLFTLPAPTACVVTGHATAGGCILALMCDYRYMTEGRKWIGLNEIKLGVPVPLLPELALRLVCGDRVATEMLYTGEFLDGNAAAKVKLVDEVTPPQDVFGKALDKVKSIGGYYARAFKAIKENRVTSVRDEYLKRQEADNQRFLDMWYDERTREGLAEAMKKY